MTYQELKEKQLTEMDKGVIYTDDEQKAKDLSDKGSNVKLTSEEEGVAFSKEETAAIAKETGKALAIALRDTGDEVAHMKAHHIEPNSFEIHVEYKKDTVTDDFSFYISGDTLHLQDFSFDKEIGGVGVKPSGEAIVHVDVLANEFKKHFKSQMSEQMDSEVRSTYIRLLDMLKSLKKHGVSKQDPRYQEILKQVKIKMKELGMDNSHIKETMSDEEWADAQERERLEKHPEKDTIKKIQALIASQQKNEATKEEEEEYHKKLDALTHKTFGKREEEMNEAPEGMYYIKVAVRDAKKALTIIDDQPALKGQVEINGSDTYYLSDEELAYDLLQDFLAQGIEVTDENIESWDEADPRDGAPSQADSYMDEESISTHDPHLAQAILDLIDSHAATAGLTDEEAKEEIIDFLKKQKVDEDAKERVARAAAAAKELATKIAFGKFDTEHGDMDKDKPNLRKYIARPGSLEEDDLDIGHQDDEPSMLKKDLYDIATYAAKLYKQLDKYDQHDGEVDFPHWWQKKVALSREYISSAQHYLEAEEKQPALDQLALEESIKEEYSVFKNYDDITGGIINRFQALKKYVSKKEPDAMDDLQKVMRAFEIFDEKMAYGAHEELEEKTIAERSEKTIRKEYDDLVGKMKQLAQHYKSAEGEAKDKIVAALKQHTARKRELEAELDAKVGGYGSDQEFDDKVQ